MESNLVLVTEYALVLDEEFKSKGYNVPTKVAPNFILKIYALFDKTVKTIVPYLGKKPNFNNERFIKVLEIEPIYYKKSILDMAYDMIEKGIVRKRF